MNKDQAIKLLIQVAHLAQKVGLLKLQEASAVLQAIQMLSQEEVKEETVEEVK